jgi:ABC-type multidrug transport system fused ATPase/permease subunit
MKTKSNGEGQCVVASSKETDESVSVASTSSSDLSASGDLESTRPADFTRSGSLIARQKSRGSAHLEWINLSLAKELLIPPKQWWKRFVVSFIPMGEAIFYKKARKQLLHPMSGQFVPGEFVAVMGPTGSGKTTFLNVIADGFAKE